jgi:hypothetical protein
MRAGCIGISIVGKNLTCNGAKNVREDNDQGPGAARCRRDSRLLAGATFAGLTFFPTIVYI